MTVFGSTAREDVRILRASALGCTVIHNATEIARTLRMDNMYTGPERRINGGMGRRESDHQQHQQIVEMQAEITRLKAVIEILFDSLQALTALQPKPGTASARALIDGALSAAEGPGDHSRASAA